MSDRKYRQSGYQEGGEAGGRSGRPGPRERREGPRGRGLGTPTATVSKCAHCGAKLFSSPGLEKTCKDCGGDLHTCTNCRYFDPSAPKECRRPIETRISAKSKRNRCEDFEPKLAKEFVSDSGGGTRDAKAAFDDLFNF